MMKKSLNSVRVILCLLVFLSIVFVCIGPVLAQTSIDNVSKSVVRVQETGGGRLVNRTGFVLGIEPPFQYVATTDDIVDVVNPVLNVWRSRDDLYPCTVYFRLQDSGIVVLRLDPDHQLHPYEPLSLGTSSMIRQGDDMFAVGYPLNVQTARNTDTSVTKSVFSRPRTDRGIFYFLMEEGTLIDRGMEGGPLVNKDGVVIGMNVFNAGRSGISGGLDIEALIDALEGRNIDFIRAGETPIQPQETTPPPPEPTPLPQVASPQLSPEGILSWTAVSEALGYEIVLYKDGQLVDTKTLGAEYTSISVSEAIDIHGPGTYTAQVTAVGGGEFLDGLPSPSSNTFVEKQKILGMDPLILGIIGGVLLLIVLAVVFLASGSKKAAPAVSVTQSSPSPVTQAKPKPTESAPVTKSKPSLPRAGIKGISGHFAGQTIELVDNQLVIGRDPRLAQLVYPQSSEEISRKHVTIRFDERTNKFILEDSSSNGTFLSSNQKLEPGKQYYLNSGDRFYIADPKEVFELKIG